MDGWEGVCTPCFTSLKRQMGNCRHKEIDFYIGIPPNVSIRVQSLTCRDISFLIQVLGKMTGLILAYFRPYVSHCTLVQVYTELLTYAHSHSYCHILDCLFKQVQTGV